VGVVEVVDARNNVMKAEEAWKLFQDGDSIHVGKGKKTVVFTPGPASQEEILKDSLGRTGNLRAPTLRVGKVFYVGYNDEMYKELMG